MASTHDANPRVVLCLQLRRRMIDRCVRPALSRTVRLRFDARSGSQMLVGPERALVLDPIASRVVELCDGLRTIDDIALALTASYAGDLLAIADDVEDLVVDLARRGLVTV